MRSFSIQCQRVLICALLFSTPGSSRADDGGPRAIDTCDYESVASLLKLSVVPANEKGPANDGTNEAMTDPQETQSSRRTAYFSSTRKADECLKKLEKAGKFAGPDGTYVEAQRVPDKGAGENAQLYKFRQVSGRTATNWVEIKVKPDKNGNYTILRKGLFDKTFSYKDREKKDGGFKKGKETFYTARFCEEKKWTLEQLEKAEKKCKDKFETHTWNTLTCECDPDGSKVKPCPNGKQMTDDEKLAAKEKCERPNQKENAAKKFEYLWEECRCEDTPLLHHCGPNFGEVGVREYARKKKTCDFLIKLDPRREWREATCDCPPVPREKPKPEYCGKIKLKHPGHKDELRNKCLKKYDEASAWNDSDCTCTDPCYEYIPQKDNRREECDVTVVNLKGEWVAEVTGKVCDQPYDNQRVLDSLKADALAKCKGVVMEEIKKFEAGQSTQPLNKTYSTTYTHPTGVVCSTSSVSVGSRASVGEFFPDNVPTFDLDKFSGSCEQGYTLKDPLLGAYRIHDGKTTQDKLSCQDGSDNDYRNIEKGNAELKTQAKKLVDDYMAQLGLSKPVSKEKLEEALKDAKINLNVMGTANRNNNNTAKTLQELSDRRKEEAERLMTEEIKRQFGSYLGDGEGPFPIKDETFVKKGISRPVGPLSPQYPYPVSYSEVCEEGDPLLASCCKAHLDPFEGTKLYQCSVRQFFDVECPQLQNSAPELHGKVCHDAVNRKAKYLKAMKGGFNADGTAIVDSDVVEDFNNLKLFDVTSSIEASDKKTVKVDQPTVNVSCNGELGTEQKKEFKNIPIYNLELKKPGFLRRLKPGCRDEKKKLRKEIDQDFGEGTFKKLMKEGEITIDAPEGK